MSDHTHVPEATFKEYGKAQSTEYARVRYAYDSSVYESVLAYHSASGGCLGNALDVGCGPGVATRELATHFNHVLGIDPGEGMIDVARSRNAAISNVRFHVSSAEEMASVTDGSVDFIIAANAAHWFDMPAFWNRAAEVLAPGGTVALWTSGEPSAHPDVPNAMALNAAFREHNLKHLVPYYEPGNLLVRDGYRSLTMPWDATTPVMAFDQSSFTRKEWALSQPFLKDQDRFFNLDMFERMLGTGSPVVRWRQAHPDAVGTEDDVVRILRREVERLLHEAGVPEGEEMLKGAAPGVLLMVKKVGAGAGAAGSANK